MMTSMVRIPIPNLSSVLCRLYSFKGCITLSYVAADTSDELEGSSSPRHHDKNHSSTTVAGSTQAQVQAAATAAFNYSAFLNASVAGGGGGGGVGGSGDSVMITSTENLLRNIQSLLKVAAENARQQDRQANYEKGEFTIIV